MWLHGVAGERTARRPGFCLGSAITCELLNRRLISLNLYFLILKRWDCLGHVPGSLQIGLTRVLRLTACVYRGDKQNSITLTGVGHPNGVPCLQRNGGQLQADWAGKASSEWLVGDWFMSSSAPDKG